ncbi:alpha/beta hydrolase family protein [Paludibacterium paludis]|uniref:Alpha/beta hydrolase family protein DUF1100 n=1 Tax=Paludibacterium paludis TaxID=1225769 RepID=A0A918U9A5_9NEIS|nr:alpha/beta fold hydrolase [Paludibacterium paludis]GGY11293.1 hypothetical protein GCM10011289_12770 [Paludibacterium paludis]
MSTIHPDTFAQLHYFFPRMMFGGTEWGEIVHVCRDIDPVVQTDPPRFWTQWFEAWKHRGDTWMAESRDQSPDEAARTRLQAAAAYHWAEFMFFQDTDRKEQCRREVAEAFRLAAPALPTASEPVRITFGPHTLPGYLFHARAEGPAPTVVLINGLDSAKEVELYQFARYFLRQGISCLIFDGPGQGELLGKSAMHCPFEAVMDEVLAVLKSHRRVDPNRLGVFGVSFGGLLALRCLAAHADAFRAAINLSGAFDVRNYREINPRVRHDFRYVFKAGGDDEMAALAERQLTVSDLPAPRGQILCIHGGNDMVFPADNCQRIAAWAGPDKTGTMLYPDEAHVCQNYFFDFMPKAAKWMRARLET